MNTAEAAVLFSRFQERKRQRAALAAIPGYRARKNDAAAFALTALATPWTNRLFDGPFYVSQEPKAISLPLVNTVFVQSADGNTDTQSGNPGDLGGGETDLHLIYEGLSRVAVDAVLAGANTVRGSGLVFGVWHPELAALRRQLGKPEYPAQVVVTASGELDIDSELMFNLPELKVFLLTTVKGMVKLLPRLEGKPWVEPLVLGGAIDFRRGLTTLKRRGVNSLCAVGGRTTVAELFDQGLINDLYLTTAAQPGGKPNTPFYIGAKGLPSLALVVEKEGLDREAGVVFQHFVVR